MGEFGFDDGTWIDHLRSASAERARAERAGNAARQEALGDIGGYRLVEQLGRGAQGTVYKAVQPRTGRTVAIKRVTLADGFDERSRARFEREVETASALRHPGIVTVHEVLAGTSAIAMDFIDGLPADAWADEVRGGAEGARRIVRSARRACDALAYAHGRGVIHRDLKPSNVLIDAEDQPHVVDFGLARDAGARGDGATLTIAGGFAGTPEYAPPEQIERGLHDVDVRGDVYAMGALLYRMLTGREPFEGASLAALFDAVRQGGAGAPSTIEGAAPGVDAELDAIVLMAMRPDREGRYATMAELAEDLGRWLDRKAVRARRATPAYYARAFVRRHPVSVGLSVLAAVVIVALGIAAGVASIALSRERARLTATLEERDDALDEATRSERLATAELNKTRFTVSMMYDVLAEAGDSPRVIEALRGKAAALDNPRIALLPEVELSARLALARAFHRLGRPGEALEQAERMLERAGGAAAVTEIAEAHALVGEIALEQGRHGDAVAPLRSALGPTAAGAELSRSHLLLTEALARSGRMEEAQAMVAGFPPTPGPAGPFMATRVRTLCEELGLEPPAWARGGR